MSHGLGREAALQSFPLRAMACDLDFFFPLCSQKAVDSGKWSLCPPPHASLVWSLVPQAPLPQTGGQPPPYVYVSPQISLAGDGRGGEGRGPVPSLGIWEGPAPMGLTFSCGLSPQHNLLKPNLNKATSLIWEKKKI